MVPASRSRVASISSSSVDGRGSDVATVFSSVGAYVVAGGSLVVC